MTCFFLMLYYKFYYMKENGLLYYLPTLRVLCAVLDRARENSDPNKRRKLSTRVKSHFLTFSHISIQI